jgi:hypothetical protein
MMYQGAIVATMDWLYPLSGFVVGAIRPSMAARTKRNHTK